MRSRFASIAGLVVLACGDSGPAHDATVRVDSSGIEIVTSSAVDRSLAWQFQPVLALGGADDGPEAFFGVPRAGVAFGPAGEIIVLDAGNKRIHVFGETGEAIRSMAREGEGPGELQFPASLFADSNGTITVHDFGHRAMVRFDSSGAYLGQIAAPSSVFGPIRSDAGAFVFATRRRDESTGRFIVRLVTSVGPDTLELLQANVPETRSVLYESCGVSLSLPPLFADPPSWDARGGSVAVSGPPEYSVRIFRDGSEVRNIRRPIRPQTATHENVLREFGEGEPWSIGNRRCIVPAEEMVAQRGFSELVPTISKVALAPEGYLWVQRELIGDKAGPIDIFDDTGEYVGTLPPTTPWPLSFASNNLMLVLETDELDVQSVVVYRIVRN